MRSTIRVEVESARAGQAAVRTLEVPAGTTVREVLRTLGRPAEGSAVFLEERSIPLDTVLRSSVRLLLVPTFSGG